jgi:hypothetical protein
LAATVALAQPPPAGTVAVTDSGLKTSPATYACTSGHPVKRQTVTLDSATRRYAFVYAGCYDPSHGDVHPSSEGHFGMPEPWTGNFYAGGFLELFVNGKDAITYTLTEMRVLEAGERGSFQAVWAHPDGQVGLRVLLLPGGNHVLCDLSWKPRTPDAIKTVKMTLRAYPSFFTSFNHRRGERHCQTPRLDRKEPETLTIQPEQDTYLYYYDAVFDTAKGEGNGPCASIIAPEGVTGGKVNIGDYAVMTEINAKPEAGHLRFALYDFSGQTNAVAAAYLKAQGAADLAQLQQADFRPLSGRGLDVDKQRAAAATLLADAAEDGKQFKPKIDGLMAKIAALKTQAEAGDWTAEADLAKLWRDSEDLFWRLRIFAVLNRAE